MRWRRLLVNREVALVFGWHVVSQAGDSIYQIGLSRPHRKDPDVLDFLEWSFWTAMRPGETRQLTWQCVNLEAGTITLPPQSAKIKRGRTIALAGPLLEVVRRRMGRRVVGSDLLFHRGYRGRLGYPIKDCRKAWAAACRAAGLIPGRASVVPFDLRRSGLRSWVRAGVTESTVIKVSGHRTRSTFDRYNIIDVEHTRHGIALLEDFLRPKADKTRTVARSRGRNPLTLRGRLAEAGGNRTHRSGDQPGAGRL